MFGDMPELSDEEYAAFTAWRDAQQGSDTDATVIVEEAPSTDEIRAAAEAQATVIEAQAAADVRVIEAQAEAQATVIEAQAEAEAGDDDDDDETMFDSDGNARPESQHWFFRPLGGKR